MKKMSKYIDKQVKGAFDELVNIATASHLLGEIAKNPKGSREEPIEGFFRTILRARLKGEAKILLSQRTESYGPEHDIVGLHQELNSRTAIVIEIKTPSTESCGIHSKIKRPNCLPKDIESLRKALDNRVRTAYELVVLFECYAVSKKGELIRTSYGKSTE